MKQILPSASGRISGPTAAPRARPSGASSHVVQTFTLGPSSLTLPQPGLGALLRPLWRRLLGIRVLAALVLVMWLQRGALGWFDHSDLVGTLPAWFATVRALEAGGCALALLCAAAFAIQDIAVSLLPEGPLRKAVLLGEEGKAAREELLSNDTLAWWMLVVPALAPLGFLAIGAATAAVSGGAPTLLSALGHVFSTKAVWAVLSAAVALAALLRR